MLNRILFCLFVPYIFFNSPLSSAQPNIQDTSKPFATIICARNCGMFRTFASLIGILYLYENGHYSGLKVDFGKVGLYYDPQYGSNWWEYYLEPIALGNLNTDTVRTVNGPSGFDCAWFTEFSLPRKQVHEIINKYIIPKQQIKKEVDQFVTTHFKQKKKIIGVHYRGTDKSSEAPRASYETMEIHIKNEMKNLQNTDIIIFVATDEQGFIDFMHKKFPRLVISYDNMSRSNSNTPIHSSGINPYKLGKEALIDCLLLSKCDVLIKTSSNLSLFSGYFNPTMPIIHVTTRPFTKPLN